MSQPADPSLHRVKLRLQPKQNSTFTVFHLNKDRKYQFVERVSAKDDLVFLSSLIKSACWEPAVFSSTQTFVWMQIRW